MKHVLTLATTIILSATAWAQKDLPQFGKIDKADLEKKNCDYDKDAEAEMLYNMYDFLMDVNFNGLTVDIRRHVRIKILNEKGLDRANIKIPYERAHGEEFISKLEAQTYNLDASGNIVVTKVDKKSIYDKKRNSLVWDQIFTFADVKPGSIIEYKYTLTRQSPAIDDWYFQRSLPVRLSLCRFAYPSWFHFSHMAYTTMPYESKESPDGGRIVKTFTMKNIPALRDEPYISSEEDYLQRISFKPISANPPGGRFFSFTKTWPVIVKDLMEHEYFGMQLKKNIKRTQDLDDQLKNISDEYQRMVTVHKYVKKNMSWDGYNSRFAWDGVKTAWDEKKGSSGEINLILVNLLKDAGLKAYPILVSTRENGRLVTANPDISQFNKVMAYVTINDKTYILDGTDQYTPSHMIPYEVMYSEGMVISKLDFNKPLAEQEWGWATIWDDKQRYRQNVALQGKLQPDGSMKGEAVVNSMGYAKINRLQYLKDGKEKFTEKYFIKPFQSINIEDVQINNADKDSMPLEQKIKFSVPVSSSGDYQYFGLNMFTGLETNPFVADTRYSDIMFGYDQNYTVYGNFTLPEGYAFEELPKNMRMIMPDTSIEFSRMMQADGNILNVRMTLEFKRPYYLTDEYDEFKEFYKKLFATLNEQIVVKKVRP
jgi:hypothetical protein